MTTLVHGESAFGMLETSVALTPDQIETKARELLAQLSLDEKIWMMSGDPRFWFGLADMTGGGYNQHTWVAGAVPRLDIPGVRFSDGPRGVVMTGATTFPVSMARGASCALWAAITSAASVSTSCVTRPGVARRRATAKTRTIWGCLARRLRAGCSAT